MIALALALLILTALLSSYLHMERTAAWWQKEEKRLFSERFFYHRLLEIFSHLEEADQEKTFFFTPEMQSAWTLPNSPSLIFSYDNGASLDTTLSGSTLGRLFVTPEGELTLITWPNREAWKEQTVPSFHREVLMDQVKQLSFSFFQVATEENIDLTGWNSGKWTKDNKALPGAIQLSLTLKDDSVHLFSFPVPEVLSIISEKP